MSKKSRLKHYLFDRFLDSIESVGNKMPHPMTLFVILSVLIILVSEWLQRLGTSVSFSTHLGEGEPVTVAVKSLFNVEGFRYILTSMTTNFTGFAPLGTVLVARIGIGIAEGSGLIDSMIKRLVLSAPKKLITAIIVFTGVMSNIAADAGYIILVPLGAFIFYSLGRHPLAGLFAAFAGVSGGFSANLLLGSLDPLLGGISTEAARILQPDYYVNATANWYFMIASTFLITLVGTFVTEKIVEPRLGTYNKEGLSDTTSFRELRKTTSDEKKGMRWALIAFLVFLTFLLLCTVPSWGILRNPQTGSLLDNSPLILGLVPILMFFFFIPGLAYGIGAKTIRSDKDVARLMGTALESMGGYLALIFVAAQFIKYFNYTHLGTIFAVNGANFLKSTGFTGIPLVIGFILLASIINLFMGSASAKWAIIAPIFIPMFMEIGYTPEFAQLIYRIGDSVTNVITPLMSYFPLVIAFAQRYDKKAGIGTLISSMMPYSFFFLVSWILLTVVWMLLGWPIGPGASIYLP